MDMEDDSLHLALDALEAKNVKDTMTFRHDWNDEVIAQLFTNLSFDKYGTIIHFRIEGD